MEDVLTRLSSLEERDKVNNSEILALQKDNVFLQRELLSAQREIFSLKEQAENSKLKKRIDRMEVTNKQLVDENKNLQKDITSLKANCDMKVKNLEDHVNQLGRVFNRYIVKADRDAELVTAKIPNLLQRTTQLEDIQLQKSNSITKIKLDLGINGNLITRRRVKLDRCVKEIRNSGYFDINSCCLITPTDGSYAINLSLMQRGDGEIQIIVANEDDESIFYYLGRTKGNLDILRTMQVLPLDKGSKISIKAMRITGEAEILSCGFSSWLL